MSESVSSGAARRAQIIKSIQSETGIDEGMIEKLVRRFYERVRADPTLTPIFSARITDWEPHLQRMCAFWSSVALMSGRYHGQPMQMHSLLPIDARHFDRWLKLFEETAREVCPPKAAHHFIQRACRIAQSLQSGVAAARGAVLGERASRAAMAVVHSPMERTGCCESPDVRQTRTVKPNNSNGSNSPLTVQSNSCRGNLDQPADRAGDAATHSARRDRAKQSTSPRAAFIQSRSSQA
jgi:hemoglobin